MKYEVRNIILILAPMLLFAFVNGYRFAVAKAEKYFRSKRKEESVKKYMVIYQDEEEYALSNLFLSILSICLYATSMTQLFRLNNQYINAQLSSFTHNILVVALVVIFVSTLALFIFAWLIPRFIFGLDARLSVRLFSPIERFLHGITYPIARQFYNFSKTFVKEMFNEKKGFSETIIKQSQLSTTMIDEVLNPDYKENKQLLENAYEFQDKKAKHVATPRNEIFYVLEDDDMEDVKQEFEDTQLSKLVVCDENIDHIVGYIHYLELFDEPSNISQIIKPISAVPEGMPLPSLLEKLNLAKQSMAWVIDEFGGTTGIVTMEDIYEALFGTIKDEHDFDIEYLEKSLPNNEYLFSGRLELEVIEEKYDINFGEDPEAETLSGYIIQHINEIPKTGQNITIGNNEFYILQVKDKRIESVKVKKKKPLS